MDVKPAATVKAMGPAPERRPTWVLDADAFRGLLDRLDPNPEQAGLKYERLRRKLILFFAGRASSEPEDGADTTLDRVTRCLAKGETIDDLDRFAYGVAWRVWSETAKRHRRHRRALGRLLVRPVQSAPPFESEAGLECISRCVRQLDPADRELILKYYACSGQEQQEERRELAGHLAITSTALRLRAYRIRRLLEACVRGCLEGRAAANLAGRRGSWRWPK
jgi:DNA-directed RNA polymerase specialized sigma24 family protein